jgi:predicted dehydrogenase
MHKVLVIGTGSIGERHVRCFQATRRAEPAIVEVNEPLRQAVADRYGIRRSYGDLQAALAEPADVAVVATPAPLHVPMAIRLAEAGAHLLIEKPLSTSLEGIDFLRRMVGERRLVAGVAYVYRSHPSLAAMRQALAGGRFGRPVQLIAVAGQHFPTYRPAYRDTYYTSRETGGGAIQDALTHLVNAGEWLIGPVERLVADAAHQVLEGVAVEDTVHLLTRQGAALGCYCLNQHQAPNEITVTVVCERGTARFEFHHNRWRWMGRPDGAWHDEPTGPLERDSLFIAQANAFLDAVEGKAVPPCTLDDGVQTLRVNLAALASVDRSAWQSLPTGG